MNRVSRRLKLKKKDKEGSRFYDCPVCRSGEIKCNHGVFYGQCNNCNLTLCDYEPLGHQEAFHRSKAQYRLNIGGYGSGKTTMACAETVEHCLERGNSRVVITAITLKQVTEAVWPELVKFTPPWFIERTYMKPTPYIKFTNGSEIMVYSSDNSDAFKSLNLTGFYIEEASGVPYAVFDQLMTRLRNEAGLVYDDDGNVTGYRYMGILSTNPDDGWIKDEFLLKSARVFASKSIDLNVYRPLMAKKREQHFHAFISSTRDNDFLPKDFISRTSAGKSVAWVRRNIDCYLDNKEGAVYPDFSKCLVEPFKIPDHWKRVVGFDPGFRDPCAIPIGAVDPKDGTIYFYGDYYEREKPVSEHAYYLKNELRGLELLIPIQGDPSIAKRNDQTGETYRDYFFKKSDYYIELANNDILYGIERVRDYMYLGKLKFFNNLDNLKMEAVNYIYKKVEGKNSNDTPFDAFNHLWDGIRYIIVKLPQDPNDMTSFYVQSQIRPDAYSSFTDAFRQDDMLNNAEVFNEVYGGIKYY